MNTIESEVSNWPGIEVAPHRFDAREFTLEGTEVGHLHDGRLLDIPFPKRIRDVLIEKERAQTHHVFPNSGWISYRVRSDEDVAGALWLLRVSYLYHLVRKGGDDADAVDVDVELAELGMSDELHRVFDETNG